MHFHTEKLFFYDCPCVNDITALQSDAQFFEIFDTYGNSYRTLKLRYRRYLKQKSIYFILFFCMVWSRSSGSIDLLISRAGNDTRKRRESYKEQWRWSVPPFTKIAPIGKQFYLPCYLQTWILIIEIGQ